MICRVLKDHDQNSDQIMFESVLLLRDLKDIYKAIFFRSNVQLMKFFALSLTFLH